MTRGKKVLTSAFVLVKIVTILALIVIAFGVGLAGVLVFQPQWLVNETTVRFLADHSEFTGYDVEANDLKVSVSSESWRNKTLKIEAHDFRIAPIKKGSFSTRGEKLYFEAGVDLLGSPVILHTIGPINVEKTTLRIISQAKEDDNKSDFSLRDFLKTVKHVTIEPMTMKDITIELQDIEAKIRSLSFNVDTQFKDNEVLVSLNATAKSKDLPFKTLVLKGKAEASYFKEADKAAEVKVDLTLKTGKTSVQLTTKSVENNGNDFKARLSLPRTLTGGESMVIASGRLRGESLKMKLSGFVQPNQKILRQVSLETCDISARILSEEKTDQVAATDCVVKVSLNNFLKKEHRALPIPEQLVFDLTAHAVTSGKDNKRVNGELKATVRTFESALYRLRGAFGLHFKGNLDTPGDLVIALNSDLGIEADRFENIVSQLDRSNLAIPAPFNSLQGSLFCSLKGTVNTEKGKAVLPVTCATDLNDKIQAVEMSVNGTASVELATKKTHIDGDVILNHVTIAAPDIAITKRIPKIRRDSRFTTGLDPDGLFQDGEWIAQRSLNTRDSSGCIS